MGPVRCPICRNETRWEGNPYRPFCSERCKLVDLGNWVTERYRVPDTTPAAPAETEARDEEEE